MKLWSIMAHCRENPCKGGVSVVVAAFFCGEVRSAFNDYTRGIPMFLLIYLSASIRTKYIKVSL